MKIFLAGGTGVIGPALVRRLIEEGHEVTAITRKPERARQLEARGLKRLAQNPGLTGWRAAA